MNARLSAFLRAIPQSNQDARPLVDFGEERVWSLGVIDSLSLLGLLDYDPQADTLRASSQTAHYTLLSLAYYAETGQSVVANWKQRGLHADVLHNGASFLHALEARRLQISPQAQPTRQQRVAQVIIKRCNPQTGQAELLFQHDANAARDQLVGGRMSDRDHDDPLETLIREIEEELPHLGLRYGQDYQLRLLIDGYSPPPSLSPTFGAYTIYTFWIYHMVGLRRPLDLGLQDRWLSLDHVLSPQFETPLEGESDHLLRLIDQQLEGGLMALPSSDSPV
ncbi:MAG: NUDIX hydrolase [Anaerolineae bacterium]|nr:NUDIX hydrolase [Anaerolineae bacterium]MDW8173574.1 NUDIX hydrolase [Anaerolineae bacterium]